MMAGEDGQEATGEKYKDVETEAVGSIHWNDLQKEHDSEENLGSISSERTVNNGVEIFSSELKGTTSGTSECEDSGPGDLVKASINDDLFSAANNSTSSKEVITGGANLDRELDDTQKDTTSSNHAMEEQPRKDVKIDDDGGKIMLTDESSIEAVIFDSQCEQNDEGTDAVYDTECSKDKESQIPEEPVQHNISVDENTSEKTKNIQTEDVGLVQRNDLLKESGSEENAGSNSSETKITNQVEEIFKSEREGTTSTSECENPGIGDLVKDSVGEHILSTANDNTSSKEDVIIGGNIERASDDIERDAGISKYVMEEQKCKEDAENDVDSDKIMLTGKPKINAVNFDIQEEHSDEGSRLVNNTKSNGIEESSRLEEPVQRTISVDESTSVKETPLENYNGSCSCGLDHVLDNNTSVSSDRKDDSEKAGDDIERDEKESYISTKQDVAETNENSSFWSADSTDEDFLSRTKINDKKVASEVDKADAYSDDMSADISTSISEGTTEQLNASADEHVYIKEDSGAETRVDNHTDEQLCRHGSIGVTDDKVILNDEDEADGKSCEESSEVFGKQDLVTLSALNENEGSQFQEQSSETNFSKEADPQSKVASGNYMAEEEGHEEHITKTYEISSQDVQTGEEDSRGKPECTLEDKPNILRSEVEKITKENAASIKKIPEDEVMHTPPDESASIELNLDEQQGAGEISEASEFRSSGSNGGSLLATTSSDGKVVFEDDIVAGCSELMPADILEGTTEQINASVDEHILFIGDQMDGLHDHAVIDDTCSGDTLEGFVPETSVTSHNDEQFFKHESIDLRDGKVMLNDEADNNDHEKSFEVLENQDTTTECAVIENDGNQILNKSSVTNFPEEEDRHNRGAADNSSAEGNQEHITETHDTSPKEVHTESNIQEGTMQTYKPITADYEEKSNGLTSSLPLAPSPGPDASVDMREMTQVDIERAGYASTGIRKEDIEDFQAGLESREEVIPVIQNKSRDLTAGDKEIGHRYETESNKEEQGDVQNKSIVADGKASDDTIAYKEGTSAATSIDEIAKFTKDEQQTKTKDIECKDSATDLCDIGKSDPAGIKETGQQEGNPDLEQADPILADKLETESDNVDKNLHTIQLKKEPVEDVLRVDTELSTDQSMLERKESLTTEEESAAEDSKQGSTPQNKMLLINNNSENQGKKHDKITIDEVRSTVVSPCKSSNSAKVEDFEKKTQTETTLEEASVNQEGETSNMLERESGTDIVEITDEYTDDNHAEQEKQKTRSLEDHEMRVMTTCGTVEEHLRQSELDGQTVDAQDKKDDRQEHVNKISSMFIASLNIIGTDTQTQNIEATEIPTLTQEERSTQKSDCENETETTEQDPVQMSEQDLVLGRSEDAAAKENYEITREFSAILIENTLVSETGNNTEDELIKNISRGGTEDASTGDDIEAPCETILRSGDITNNAVNDEAESSRTESVIQELVQGIHNDISSNEDDASGEPDSKVSAADEELAQKHVQATTFEDTTNTTADNSDLISDIPNAAMQQSSIEKNRTIDGMSIYDEACPIVEGDPTYEDKANEIGKVKRECEDKKMKKTDHENEEHEELPAARLLMNHILREQSNELSESIDEQEKQNIGVESKDRDVTTSGEQIIVDAYVQEKAYEELRSNNDDEQTTIEMDVQNSEKSVKGSLFSTSIAPKDDAKDEFSDDMQEAAHNYHSDTPEGSQLLRNCEFADDNLKNNVVTDGNMSKCDEGSHHNDKYDEKILETKKEDVCTCDHGNQFSPKEVLEEHTSMLVEEKAIDACSAHTTGSNDPSLEASSEVNTAKESLLRSQNAELDKEENDSYVEHIPKEQLATIQFSPSTVFGSAISEVYNRNISEQSNQVSPIDSCTDPETLNQKEGASPFSFEEMKNHVSVDDSEWKEVEAEGTSKQSSTLNRDVVTEKYDLTEGSAEISYPKQEQQDQTEVFPIELKPESNPVEEQPVLHDAGKNSELENEENVNEEKDGSEKIKQEDTDKDGAEYSGLTAESRDFEHKKEQKKSPNILLGVGSKFKRSLSKVKKIITGKSSHSKTEPTK